MHVICTDRGFERVDFIDSYGQECSLQASSAIGEYPDSWDRPGTSFVWLGATDKGPHLDELSRMHLNREQVAELVVHLQAWLGVGRLTLADAEGRPDA